MSAGRPEETCPDCQAGPHHDNPRVTIGRKDKATGEYYAITTWHTRDCPAYTVDQILMADGVRRAKESSEWGRKEFPAAYERLIRAVLAVELGEAAAPFVAALVELVEAQGEDLGRVVLPEQWVEILNRHILPPGGQSPTA